MKILSLCLGVVDAWCAANALHPNYALQAHTAPLGLVFYNGQGKYAFPSIFSNVIFIAEHGSWDADVPRGYKVIGVTTDGHGNVMNNSAVDFFAYQGPGKIKHNATCVQPLRVSSLLFLISVLCIHSMCVSNV